MGLKAEYWFGQCGWQEVGQNASGESGGGIGWNGHLGLFEDREEGWIVIGRLLGSVVVEVFLGSLSRFFVSDGKPIW